MTTMTESPPTSSTTSPPTPAPAPTPTPIHTINTTLLPARLLSDAAAATTAGILVAPIITIIDRAIIENSSGRNKLGPSLVQSAKELLSRPDRFLLSRPTRLIFALYAGTYLTANSIDTLSSTFRNNEFSSTTHGPAKFTATTAANISLCLYKDAQFAQMFGTSAAVAGVVARKVPLTAFALFGFRDCLTVFASFNMPPIIAPLLPVSVESTMSRANAAQFIAPVAVQLVSTPIHLLGLDLYNRPGLSITSRVTKVSREWFVSCVARMCRILPAFGLGAVVNTTVRSSLMVGLEGK